MLYNTTTTSTTGTTYTWTIAPPKETRFQKKMRQINERSNKRLEVILAKLGEDEIKNAWRPNIRGGIEHGQPGTKLGLAWWNLARPDADDGWPTWRKERARYDNDWCGVTMSNATLSERRKINAFIKTIRHRDVFRVGWTHEQTIVDGVGRVPTCSVSYWFKKVEDIIAFDAMLRTLPQRTVELKLAEDFDSVELKRLIQGLNHVVYTSHEGSILSMEPNDQKIAIIKAVFS